MCPGQWSRPPVLHSLQDVAGAPSHCGARFGRNRMCTSVQAEWDRWHIRRFGGNTTVFIGRPPEDPCWVAASGEYRQTAPDLSSSLDEGNVLAPRRGAVLVHDDFLGILGQEAAPDVLGDVGARPVKRAA